VLADALAVQLDQPALSGEEASEALPDLLA
jgi:hypothetical protein